MANTSPRSGSVTSALTDGTGMSPITGIKLVKDFVLDFLVTVAAGLGAGAGLEALDLGTVISAPDLAGIAVASALIKALYRSALRWASS